MRDRTQFWGDGVVDPAELRHRSSMNGQNFTAGNCVRWTAGSIAFIDGPGDSRSRVTTRAILLHERRVHVRYGRASGRPAPSTNACGRARGSRCSSPVRAVRTGPTQCSRVRDRLGTVLATAGRGRCHVRQAGHRDGFTSGSCRRSGLPRSPGGGLSRSSSKTSGWLHYRIRTIGLRDRGAALGFQLICGESGHLGIADLVPQRTMVEDLGGDG